MKFNAYFIVLENITETFCLLFYGFAYRSKPKSTSLHIVFIFVTFNLQKLKQCNLFMAYRYFANTFIVLVSFFFFCVNKLHLDAFHIKCKIVHNFRLMLKFYNIAYIITLNNYFYKIVYLYYVMLLSEHKTVKANIC